MEYDLSHLTQHADQVVFGPIQDDEALLLYALIRTMRLHNILEVGGLFGYSATNFLKAISGGTVYTVDINPVKKLAPNHYVITKNCADIDVFDIEHKIDLIFFDAHVFEEQLELFTKLKNFDLINDDTVLAFHDTNLHPCKIHASRFIESENGWCFIKVERNLVNYFKSIGYDAICCHTSMEEKSIPFRHGITIMRKFKELKVA
jgi:hypothetical protein